MKVIVLMGMVISIVFGGVQNIKGSTAGTTSVFCTDNYATSVQHANSSICTYDGRETKCSSTWSINQASQWACRNHNTSKKKTGRTIKVKDGALVCDTLKGMKKNLKSEISKINIRMRPSGGLLYRKSKYISLYI